MIANIFGMYIGCNVMILPKFNLGSFRTQLVGVSTTGITLSNWQHNKVRVSSNFEEFESIKLILKPLSAMTEEDKREFLKKFEVEFKSLTLEKGVLQIHKQIKRDLTVYECFWLASKGYDIGLVEDEYKEVER